MEQIGTILMAIPVIFLLGVIPSLALVMWGAWFSEEFKETSKIKFPITCFVTGTIVFLLYF